MSEAAAEDAARKAPGRGPVGELLAPLPLLLAAAVVGGVAWWLLVPSPAVTERAGVLVAAGVPELFATQDGVFAVLAVGLGLVTGVALLLRPGGHRVLRVVVVVAGSALASLGMWRLGVALSASGPDDAAPLTVHATGVLALWPALAATVAFVGQLWSDLVIARPASRRARP